ncbi:cbb3-type cytochrome oxidase assembly protein CcoS [Polycladidibacter hongkongensis]|uniref:cbb3-type cytochrome oxidase assembly protein CcoS n=1 Tax=Polycladidibacter hongkongensis TaxID=1647556 RepID=UPI000832285F|nr:cbb3-type cytochrome oxidase assembly protein CcoS [Pseudovibrio hongkongensis]
MEILLFLIPVALLLGGVGLCLFLWALRSGQYEDLDGAAWRVLDDSDLPEQTQKPTKLARQQDLR